MPDCGCPVVNKRGNVRHGVSTIPVSGWIKEQTIEPNGPGSAAGKFFDVEYKIPVEIVGGKTKITLRFSAKSGSEIAAVYGVRLIRADAER